MKTHHLTVAGGLERDEMDFVIARCECGAEFGAYPDEEEAIDALMTHAFLMGEDEGRYKGLAEARSSD